MYDIENIDEVFTETTLSDSSIYAEFNKSSSFMSLLMNAINKSTVITEEYITEQLFQIERTRMTSIAPKVIQAFRNGDITIMHGNNKEVRVPQAAPFIVTRVQGKVKAIAFTHNYATMGKAEASGVKRLNISYKDLYTLMEAAFVAHNYNTYSNKLTKSMGLMKITCALYTNMVVRILNKNYSIMNEFDVYDSVVYCIGKFYLERVWMSTNEAVNRTYALSNIKETNGGRGINLASIERINEEYDAAEIGDIEALIKFISTLSPRLREINYRFFLQAFMMTYKTPAIFGLEVLPYFLFSIEASINGSYIINRDLIMDAISMTKGMKSFYPELTKVII
jgi:hypothetical protein